MTRSEQDPTHPFTPRSAGLCAVCRHARPIRSARGSAFLLCEYSKQDPAFPRYPALPVLRCSAYQPPETDPPVPRRATND